MLILLYSLYYKTYITRHWNKKWHKASFNVVRKLWEDGYIYREVKLSLALLIALLSLLKLSSIYAYLILLVA